VNDAGYLGVVQVIVNYAGCYFLSHFDLIIRWNIKGRIVISLVHIYC